jgi:hypothetical protein
MGPSPRVINSMYIYIYIYLPHLTERDQGYAHCLKGLFDNSIRWHASKGKTRGTMKKNLCWVLCGRCNFSTCFDLTYNEGACRCIAYNTDGFEMVFLSH